jgi:hypothetical protein
VSLRLVSSVSVFTCQMKSISDRGPFHAEGVKQCHRFGNWGIANGVAVEYRACSQHLPRVLTILYSEDAGPFTVIPLRKLPGS